MTDPVVTDDGVVEIVAKAIEAPFLPHGYELKPHLLKAAARAALAASDRDVLVGENARLREALKPFARIAELRESYSDPEAMLVMISLTQCREARAALLPLAGEV